VAVDFALAVVCEAAEVCELAELTARGSTGEVCVELATGTLGGS
jgi:hypothetical protein